MAQQIWVFLAETIWASSFWWVKFWNSLKDIWICNSNVAKIIVMQGSQEMAVQMIRDEYWLKIIVKEADLSPIRCCSTRIQEKKESVRGKYS